MKRSVVGLLAKAWEHLNCIKAYKSNNYVLESQIQVWCIVWVLRLRWMAVPSSGILQVPCDVHMASRHLCLSNLHHLYTDLPRKYIQNAQAIRKSMIFRSIGMDLSQSGEYSAIRWTLSGSPKEEPKDGAKQGHCSNIGYKKYKNREIRGKQRRTPTKTMQNHRSLSPYNMSFGLPNRHIALPKQLLGGTRKRGQAATNKRLEKKRLLKRARKTSSENESMSRWDNMRLNLDEYDEY